MRPRWSVESILGAGPSAIGLGEVARCDPQLAHALIRPDLLGWGEPSCGWGWEIINLTGRFVDTTADQPNVIGQLNGIVEADLWVRKVTYTVRRPNAFPGNIFKAQSDYFNSQNPNIDFTLTVKSYCRYVISDTFTPLENIEQTFECVCPVGFVLGCSSQMTAQFINRRALAVDENPTEAIISFHAIRLPTRYDSCSIEKAVQALQEQGILQGPYNKLPPDGP
jgi:hypothetical protein